MRVPEVKQEAKVGDFFIKTKRHHQSSRPLFQGINMELAPLSGQLISPQRSAGPVLLKCTSPAVNTGVANASWPPKLAALHGCFNIKIDHIPTSQPACDFHLRPYVVRR